ncbi:MAG TPA: hypothetical protein QF665_01490 [Alphaproteobacteria bacterium]|jgi:hypothetical protein|nr:hypothetical protein [Alphaproteobacteria bacterium]
MKSETYDFDDRYEGPTGPWRRIGHRLARYVQSRRLDHWIMFLAGAVVGSILG